jgi:hypothetical protein
VLVTRKAKNLWRSLSRSRPGEERPLQSDLGDYPKPVNEALYSLMRAETKLMKRFDMPFGVSILAVATRPLDAVSQPSADPSLVERAVADHLAESAPVPAGAAASASLGSAQL